jgi:hypothetical protein
MRMDIKARPARVEGGSEYGNIRVTVPRRVDAVVVVVVVVVGVVVDGWILKETNRLPAT